MTEAPRRRRRQPRNLIDDEPAQDAAAAAPPIAQPAAPVPTPAPAASSADAAARRAAEIFEHNKGDFDGTDEYYIDQSLIPDGWEYQWKRKTTGNMEDPAYQVQLQQGGWTPVPASRHPQMMPSTGHFETIERKGQILMEMPKVVTERARMLEKRRALEQVRVKEEQLGHAPGPGQFERGTHPQAQARVNKNYEAIPIPKD